MEKYGNCFKWTIGRSNLSFSIKNVFQITFRAFFGEFQSDIKSSYQTCSMKKVFLKVLQNSLNNICTVSYLIKLQAPQEYLFIEHFRTTTSLTWKFTIFRLANLLSDRYFFAMKLSCFSSSWNFRRNPIVIQIKRW